MEIIGRIFKVNWSPKIYKFQTSKYLFTFKILYFYIQLIFFGLDQLSDSITNTATANSSKNDNAASSTSPYEISKTEEDSLLKLMSECDFASSNAEKFMEKLQDELLYLDTVSLHLN